MAHPPTAGADEALTLTGIVKQYGAVRALDGASLTVRRGTLHAVLGENGAGKTTLMRVAFGLVRPNAGEIRVDGTPRHFETPRDAIAARLGMVHQHFTIVPTMTVAENVALGGRGRYDPRQAAARVRALGDATGLRLDPNARADTLGVAAQQRLEVLKALARGGGPDGVGGTDAPAVSARLLILDEPAAVLAPAESEELLRWLRGWVDAGGTAVLVTHKLRDALRYADAITVLRGGRTVLTTPNTSAAAHRGPEPSVDEHLLTAAMLGTDAGMASTGAAPSDSGADGRPIVTRVSAVGVTDAAGVIRLRDATLELRAGTVVGVAAVEGSGQHELLRVLAGRLAPSTGTVERPPRVAFIPEDRHRDALLLDGTLTENLALAGAGARRGRLDWPRVRDAAGTLVARADVRGGTPTTPARALSGGNQQKFVVARELDARPTLVVAENPTRGLDVRASAGLRTRLREAAAAGAAVVVYASDLDEVLGLADEMIVVYDGTVRRAPVDRRVVGRLMLGASS
ncbi:heme ABC transporter ATP-binding protein [Gemmatimonadetes bacterium T265]|nr:heme ABC transporter ATP-binding protein [Gemmatimonadetes bacterium T265]